MAISPLIFKPSSRQEKIFSVLSFHLITLPSVIFFPPEKQNKTNPKHGGKGREFFFQS